MSVVRTADVLRRGRLIHRKEREGKTTTLTSKTFAPLAVRNSISWVFRGSRKRFSDAQVVVNELHTSTQVLDDFRQLALLLLDRFVLIHLGFADMDGVGHELGGFRL